VQNARVISRKKMRHLARDMSRTTEWRQIKNNPDWPTLVQITPGLWGYFEADADAYFEKLAARAAERDGKPVEHDREEHERDGHPQELVTARASRPIDREAERNLRAREPPP
jgi:predicted DNA-binding transcriptional regulator AlpA